MSRTDWLAPILALVLAGALGLGAVACGEVRCARPVTPDRPEPAPPETDPDAPGGPTTPPATPPGPE